MSGERTVPAFCAGRLVEVAVKPAPIDARTVRCPSCGAVKGRACWKIADGHPERMWSFHASREALARK